jgi:choline dehydrogenase-like flavoprotein
VHELGGARMGVDPRTSVLSPFNQCWDARNLFVVDGSAFPTAGWQNPTLTMMALAVRAAGFMVDAARRGEL